MFVSCFDLGVSCLCRYTRYTKHEVSVFRVPISNSNGLCYVRYAIFCTAQSPHAGTGRADVRRGQLAPLVRRAQRTSQRVLTCTDSTLIVKSPLPYALQSPAMLPTYSVIVCGMLRCAHGKSTCAVTV